MQTIALNSLGKEKKRISQVIKQIIMNNNHSSLPHESKFNGIGMKKRLLILCISISQKKE